MKDWHAIKNKKKHFMERTHSHCPIRTWDQFSSVSWQEPEQEDYQQHWWRWGGSPSPAGRSADSNWNKYGLEMAQRINFTAICNILLVS